MPLPVERLTAESHDPAVQEAISLSIEQCMKEGGKSQEECAAMAYEMARDKTGKELGYGKSR